MQQVWITRAQPGAQATARRVAALGLTPVVQPLLEVRETGTGLPELEGIAALAFTSANAVRAFAGRSDDRALPVFAVGEATAEAARAAGFGDVTTSFGGTTALADLIAARREHIAGAILHPSAAEPAGDLAGDLAQAGLVARRLVLYETLPADIPSSFSERLASLAFVLVHSPRAARILRGCLDACPAPGLAAICLSAAVAAPLDGAALASVRAASTPEEEALVTLLAQAAGAH